MSTSPRPVGSAFALLIGISDYSAYNQSIQGHPGRHDLPAGRNDALASYRTCRELGIAPEHIHVLSCPALTPGDFADGEPGYIGRATSSEIVAQLAWLSQRLACEPGRRDAPVGLLAYSGHGDFAGGELALCPSDVRAKKGAGPAEDLENVLPFYLVAEILRSRPGAADNLTVLLDCCFAPPEAAWGPGKRSSLTGRGRRKAALHLVRPLGACTIMAAMPGDVARLGKLGGREQGAFTWAVSVIAEAWRAEWDRKGEELTISLGDLVGRAKVLLGTLSLPQAITLHGPRSGRDLCFVHRKHVRSVFRPGTDGREQAEPDVADPHDFTPEGRWRAPAEAAIAP